MDEIFNQNEPTQTWAATAPLSLARNKKSIRIFLQEISSSISEKGKNGTSALKDKIGNMNFNFNSRKTKHMLKKSMRIVLPLLFLIVMVLVIRIAISSTGGNSSTNQTSNAQLALSKPMATQPINKTFTFTLKDASGNNAGSFTYIIQSAELDREIIVQNKPLVAVAGREFLILNLKIVNKLDKGISINTRDYIRLSTNNDTADWLAPEIYNDPVAVQAISTMYTRIGFPIYTTDTHLLLQVGEINGSKTKIPLHIQ